LIATGATHAASKDGKKRAAKTACLAGDYAKGVALLAELYVDTNDPMFIFNQGRCFEQNGRYEDAVIRFREYQRKLADAGGAPDVEADKHIADCFALLEKQKAPGPEPDQAARPSAGSNATAPAGGAGLASPEPAPVQPPAAVPEPPSPAGPATLVAPPPAPVVPAGASPANATSSSQDAPMPMQRKLGYGAGAIGILGLGIGLTAYLMARSYVHDANALGCNSSSCAGPGRSQYEDAQSSVMVSNVASISGGILVLGGIILVLTSPSASSAPRSVALVPLVGPGLGQLALTGRF
jgi:hypothetical protein